MQESQRITAQSSEGQREVRCTSAQSAPHQRIILDRLLAAHEGYFDVERDHRFGGRAFDGYAQFHSSAERYVLTKRAKLWGVNVHEHMFFLCCDELTSEELADLTNFMTATALEKVQPDPEHMTTYLTLVVIAGAATDDVHRAVRRTRFRKNLRFGLQGWVDLRLALVDLGGQEGGAPSHARITTNSQGKKLRETLEKNTHTGV